MTVIHVTESKDETSCPPTKLLINSFGISILIDSIAVKKEVS